MTIVGLKGGAAKTTTAVHLAAYLQEKAATLLVDADPTRSATRWGQRGQLPFKVVDERQAAKYAPQFQHVVIDTQTRPGTALVRNKQQSWHSDTNSGNLCYRSRGWIAQVGSDSVRSAT